MSDLCAEPFQRLEKFQGKFIHISWCNERKTHENGSTQSPSVNPN